MVLIFHTFSVNISYHTTTNMLLTVSIAREYRMSVFFNVLDAKPQRFVIAMLNPFETKTQSPAGTKVSVFEINHL